MVEIHIANHHPVVQKTRDKVTFSPPVFQIQTFSGLVYQNRTRLGSYRFAPVAAPQNQTAILLMSKVLLA